MPINERIFREYDIRGIADRDLTDDTCLYLARAIAQFTLKKSGTSVAMGRDCRVSSPRIHAALEKGFLSMGMNVVDVGMVPTPLLYFATKHLETSAGVMITGSHNPPEHNGLKICIGPGTIHGEEIQELKKVALTQPPSNGKVGKASKTDIIQPYIEMVKKNIGRKLNLKIVVDSGNGMGGIVAPKLYRELGCDVIDLYSEPDGTFPNHHPDPTVLETLTDLIEKVKTSGSIVGIGFDGDADRIGVVDPDGSAVYGDELLVIFAREILSRKPGATIISEVKASHRLFLDIKSHGGNPILWKTGHSLIKAKMREVKAELAGEMSGHIFFQDRYYGFDDALYSGARLLEILDASRKSPRQIIQDLPKSFTTPEIREDCPDEIKFTVVASSRKKLVEMGLKVNSIDGARIEFPDGWGLVRASNTQPVLVFRFEADTEKRLQEIRHTVESTVRGCIAALK